MLDIVIEVVASDLTSLPAVEVAGEGIAVDAAFNMRMADLQGKSSFESMRTNTAEYEIAAAEGAWSSLRFPSSGTGHSPPRHMSASSLLYAS